MLLAESSLVPLMKGNPQRAELWFGALVHAMRRFDITTPARVAAFLAQLAHESDGFGQLVENLRYSAERLCEVWPRHFYLEPDEAHGRADASACAFKPETIANIAYAHRMGNGGPETGDGWRYRGRGLLQVTGRDNYRMLAPDLQLDLEGSPDLLVEPLNAAVSAGLMWQRLNCNALADAQTEEAFHAITLAINGGDEGRASRLAYWQLASQSIGS